MDKTIIILLVISVLLFIISFFKKDRNKLVEQQIENFSITLMQEIYQLKKKITVLEEEILVGQDELYFSNNEPLGQHQLRDQILGLYEAGHSVEDISTLKQLTTEEVEEILNDV